MLPALYVLLQAFWANQMVKDGQRLTQNNSADQTLIRQTQIEHDGAVSGFAKSATV